MPLIFLLSPASSGGKRAGLVYNDTADFALALKVRTAAGAPLGEVFSFLSGLYFRGKLAYAREFARPPNNVSGVHIITPTDGLSDPDRPITLSDLRRFADVAIDAKEPRYRLPLEGSARGLAEAIGSHCDVVLLGSVATDKYVEVLGPVFGERLLFPIDFVGQGDMYRGGLMLRRVASGKELEYVAVSDSARRGKRERKKLRGDHS
ncbi:MAG TPA: hypothetical protein VNJ04_04765 [Gemmatimonadaceae bacterium]|nr:hypothetical protein [Gemmatimonadaceae bacterium]